MDDPSPRPDEAPTRTARCSGCGRPVWPATLATDAQEPAALPDLCDYCRAASY